MKQEEHNKNLSELLPNNESEPNRYDLSDLSIEEIDELIDKKFNQLKQNSTDKCDRSQKKIMDDAPEAIKEREPSLAKNNSWASKIKSGFKNLSKPCNIL